jgi:hypothetical protein
MYFFSFFGLNILCNATHETDLLIIRLNPKLNSAFFQQKFMSNNSSYKNGGRSASQPSSDEATMPLMATAEEVRTGACKSTSAQMRHNDVMR